MPGCTHVNRPYLYGVLVTVICSFFLQASAQGTPLQGKKISLSIKKASMSDILYQISKKSGITIYFIEDDVSMYTGIDCEAKEQEVSSILTELFRNKSLEYSILSPKYIGVKKAPAKSSGNDFQGDTLSVSGTVTDEGGNSIPGATILLKGSQVGTITNDKGYFIIHNVPANGTLMISSISYTTREVAIRRRNNIGIAELGRTIKPLDDVVILAYTKATGRTLVGNVSSVKSKAIQNTPVTNPLLTIAGRVPGVTINQATGFGGSGVDITIQGMNSLQNGVVPFYVIDGVPYAQTLLPNLGGILKSSGRGAGSGPVDGNPLAFINPQDIESIEILKDADATSIYGSRAANGAIIITTKRGKSGKMKLDVNFQTGFGQVASRLDLMNTQEYLSMRNEAIANDNLVPGPGDYDLDGTWSQTKYTDWQKVLIGNKATFRDVQTTLSGGTENAQYLFAANYRKEKTVFPTDLADEKVSFRFNSDVTSNDKRFKFTFSGSYLVDNNHLPNTDLTYFAAMLPPNVPDLINQDGSLSWGPTSSGASSIFSHPFAALTSVYFNKTTNLISNATLSYNIFKSLQLKSNFGYTNLATEELSTSPSTITPPEYRPTFNRSASYGNNYIRSWIIEPQLNLNQRIGPGNLQALLGFTIQQNDNSRKIVIGNGYASDFVLENINAATSLTSLPGSAILSQYRYNAAFFQASYNFQDTYIFNLSGRRDGSSRFGPKNRFHNFGAIGAAWIFSNEKFIKDNISFLSFGKLKSSYGSTGNDQIGDYSFLSLYQDNNPEVPYRGGSSLAVNRIANPFLQWELTKKLGVGLDLGFIEDKFLFGVNYFSNRSSNMLVTAPLPLTAGPVGGLIANIPIVVANVGWEFSLHTTNVRAKNFVWTSDFNFTLPKNYLKSFQDLSTSVYSENYVIGEPINITKTYKFNGVNEATGKYEYLDFEGKVTNDPGSDYRNYTQYMNPNPKFYGGITNTLSYKGLSLDFLLQYTKRLGTNPPGIAVPPGSYKFNQSRSQLHPWQKPGDHTNIQRYTTSDGDLINAYYALNNSNAYWGDASFLRVKNISLSYSIPSEWANRMKISSCRLYFNCQNALTFTKYEGLDPESLSNTSLPPLRVFSFGINVSL